ncbi:putative retrotransposon gag domain, aspartic peptidase domain protein [Tanacetum coccineum]
MIDDLLWEMEQYLEVVNIVDDTNKIKMGDLVLEGYCGVMVGTSVWRYQGTYNESSRPSAVGEDLIYFGTRREPSKPKIKGILDASYVMDLLKLEIGLRKRASTEWKAYKYVEASINGTNVRALVDSSATHNFMSVDEAKRLGISATKGSGRDGKST